MREHSTEQVCRAFEIADEAMFELICAHGVQQDSNGLAWGLTGEDCVEVKSLAEASCAIRDAYEWLEPRGYIELLSDAEGEYIAVLRRPGE